MFWGRKEEPPPRDWRLLATIGIWILTTLLFALSIPIAAIVGSALISLVVLGAAVLATLFIWALGGRNWQDEKRERLGREAAETENAQLRAQVEELVAQVEALETMRRYERRAGVFGGNDAPTEEEIVAAQEILSVETLSAPEMVSQTVTKIRARFKGDKQKIAS